MAADAVFYFDLACPECYVAAERVMHVFAPPPEWQPVLARTCIGAFEPSVREELERHAQALGLPPFRWPEDQPFESERAMLAATYAKEIGRGVAFAQAAFRQAFAGGHSLADDDYVLIAAAACEMHPNAVLRAIERRGVRAQLTRATDEARRVGVSRLPTVRLGDRLLVGDQLLNDDGVSIGAPDLEGVRAPAQALAR
jgi:2-hydroxychromene-2-carboxylate isomerase